jgi:hypothetical protein
VLTRTRRANPGSMAIVRGRRAAVFAMCALAALAMSMPRFAAAQTASESNAATAPRERLYLVIFSLGPAWVAGRPPGEQPAFREHGQNLKRLRDADRIALGARYADKGMIVLRSESEAAARREIAADPGVQAGIFTFELNELVPFYSGYVGSSPRN